MPRRWSQPEPEQLPLLDRTSRSDQRERVLAAIREAGTDGVTLDSLAEHGVCLLQTACPIVADLIRAGQVRECGERRQTRAGHYAAVLVASGVALPPAQAGDLVPRQLSARRPLAPRRDRHAEAEAAMVQRRREADAEKIILAGRRAGQDDATIRAALTEAGLSWPT